MNSNPDKRAQRTEKAIQDAFERLISTMPLADITVTRLTQEADINRKTFYLHYNSIEDLLNGQVDNISHQMLSILSIKPMKEIYSDPGFFFDQYSKLVLKHHSVARALTSSNEYAPYMRKIGDRIADSLTNRVKQSFPMSDKDATIVAYFLIHNTLSLFQLYLQEPNTMTIDELREYIIRLNMQGLSTFSKLELKPESDK